MPHEARLLERIWKSLNGADGRPRLSIGAVSALLLIHFRPKDEDGWVCLTHAEIGLGIGRASNVTVIRSLSELKNIGLLAERGVRGKPHYFKVVYADGPPRPVEERPKHIKRRLRIKGQGR